MLISNETREEELASVFTEVDGAELLERIADLKNELYATRAREEAAQTALRNLRLELERAYGRIAQQQDTLRLLAARVQA